MFNPALIGLLVVALVIVGGVGGRAFMRWRRRRRLERDRKLPVPDGHRELGESMWLPPNDGQRIGPFLFFALGTYGVKQMLRVLQLLDAGGMAWLVGAILVIENDALIREEFDRGLPEVYRDRIVRGYTAAASGGGGNQSPAESRETVELWGSPIPEAVARVLALYRRRNASQLPAEIHAYLSFGGQIESGRIAITLLHKAVSVARGVTTARIIGFAVLAEHEDLRRYWQAEKAAFEEAGVYCWILTDKLADGEEVTTLDNGLAALVVVSVTAPLRADQPVRFNNVIRHAVGKKPGAVLAYRVFHDELPAFPLYNPEGEWTGRASVDGPPLVDLAFTGLRRVELGEAASSVDMPLGVEGRSIFDVVITSLRLHEDLLWVKDRVFDGLRLRRRFGPGSRPVVPAATANGSGSPAEVDAATTWTSRYGGGNYDILFGSIVTWATDPESATCPVIVVRLAAVTDWDQPEVIGQIVALPEQRQRSLQLAAPLATAQTVVESTEPAGSEQASVAQLRESSGGRKRLPAPRKRTVKPKEESDAAETE